MAIHFKVIRWKNLLSTGSQFTEISLDRSSTTLIVGENGAGKCVHPSTEIDIKFENADVEAAFREFLT